MSLNNSIIINYKLKKLRLLSETQLPFQTDLPLLTFTCRREQTSPLKETLYKSYDNEGKALLK